MTDPLPTAPVVIVGAGPVGLALALGLARHGVRSVVLEREATTSRHSKAAGIHVRTREALRKWGIEERFLATGHLATEVVFHDVDQSERALFRIDFHQINDEVHRPGLLVLEQSETERILLEAVGESGQGEVVFGAEVTDLNQCVNGVRLHVRRADENREETIDAAYVVGCDGASSFVRDAIGSPFQGRTYRLRPMLADVTVDDARDELPWPRLADRYAGPRGMTAALRLRPGLWRIIHLESGSDVSDEVPPEEVQHRVDAVLGRGPVGVVWSSRFRVHRRSTPRFRRGRVLLAGDAAHVHSPAGGQGMNAGIQDAHGLAWMLAGALSGGDGDRLLDAYDIERRGVVVGDVGPFTDVLTRVFLQLPGRLRRAAFAILRCALRIPVVHRRGLRRLAMLDLRLPSSPLLDRADRAAGIRLPDPLLRAPDGSRHRLHDLLPVGPALLHVTRRADSAVEMDAVRPVDALLRIGPDAYRDPSGLIRRLLGGDDGWMLVRPDGYVAWARTDPVGLGPAVAVSTGRRASASA